ncbi:D-alanyl-D-alanine carboxypeptidase (penicillin-binding protein 5/6) [Defluviimonas denitrificans]|uniref:serine-type D-Ala-D-Ala carboxypeptidase n=1 Tax=Albidovulum denitrificans TaxID=404881 RepID=A0A2S8S875_9RHOB|nr:D-alanyl-D-alanine carboxypeptidase family protein [Defluviimonas denitrificans]PQV57027.1 D-alanyl-D-alanine carboxypeptidase (penicillin-binding protein 5/6) [Defluviimonas denitrificans]
MILRLAALIVLALTVALPARAFETRAKAAWVYDVSTGTVLLEKNAHEKLPPASMSKLMTINMLFEALRDGRVNLDDRFPVSSHAKSMQGSTMFLNETDRPTVEELIKGIVVLSGNDACVVVAEGLAGTEEAFARQMNERAKALGMTDSTFANASGWPNPNQRMSMHDLGILAARLIREFPEYYGYFGLTEFPYDNRAPDNRFNRNPLLKLGIGADGLKTGHTEESGYGLVGSAIQNGRRIVVVITGMATDRERSQEAERILNWAFREFVQKTVATKGTRITDADVWMGSKTKVGLVLDQDLSMLLPSLAQDKLKAEVAFTTPIEAPIAEGQKLAEMTITVPGMEPTTVPLVADQPVAKGGFASRMKTAFGVLTQRALVAIGS